MRHDWARSGWVRAAEAGCCSNDPASSGARLDQQDKQGRTALDIAQGGGGGGRGGAGAGGGRGGGSRGNAEAAALLRNLMAKNGIPVPPAPAR